MDDRNPIAQVSCNFKYVDNNDLDKHHSHTVNYYLKSQKGELDSKYDTGIPDEYLKYKDGKIPQKYLTVPDQEESIQEPNQLEIDSRECITNPDGTVKCFNVPKNYESIQEELVELEEEIPREECVTNPDGSVVCFKNKPLLYNYTTGKIEHFGVVSDIIGDYMILFLLSFVIFLIIMYYKLYK